MKAAISRRRMNRTPRLAERPQLADPIATGQVLQDEPTHDCTVELLRDLAVGDSTGPVSSPSGGRNCSTPETRAVRTSALQDGPR